ncbi:hypothetical protein [Nocardia asteroides]
MTTSDTGPWLTPTLAADLRAVVDYARHGEERDYTECDQDARARHILHPIRRLSAWLDGAATPTTSFTYIQQGGASTELYLHAFDSGADAEAGRRDDTSFATTPVVAIPALTGEQLDAVEELIQQIGNLTYDDGPTGHP